MMELLSHSVMERCEKSKILWFLCVTVSIAVIISHNCDCPYVYDVVITWNLAMYRVLNVKHRIVRRIDVGRAPLATFDSIDLGDDECKDINRNSDASNKCLDKHKSCKGQLERGLCDVGIPKAETIGGAHSKKALSQAGGEGKEEKGADSLKESEDNKQTPDNVASDVKPCQTSSTAPEKIYDEKEGKNLEDKEEYVSKSPKKESKEDIDVENQKKSSTPLASCSLSRQGTIGRVSIPIKKQSSVSSSSSSETCNDTHFTFTTSRPSIAHLDSAEGGNDLPDSPCAKATVLNLVPDNIDPKQILSPSKRKAYEKRLERLKVTTSPIARPRSNAPINVVTLDEYANLSSPEPSPLPHSILQDKLKITLPCDEFTKSPKPGSSRRKSEDVSFEFSEDILFRCTKSALVADEDGHLPVSPRRVLIPPTITPTNSPKLSSSPRIGPESFSEVSQVHNAPKLIYMTENDNVHKFFGSTFDESENENWADFPDSSINFEKADIESSEKEELSSNLCPESQEESSEASSVTEESLSVKENEKCNDFDISKEVNIGKNLNSSLTDDKNTFSYDSPVGQLSDTDAKQIESNTLENFPPLNALGTDRDKIHEPNPEAILELEENLVVEITHTLSEPKSKNETVEVPLSVSNFSQHSSDLAFCDTAFDNKIFSVETSCTSTVDKLIHIPHTFADEKPVSFSEASPHHDANTLSDHTSSPIASLLDAPSEPIQDDTSLILPIPFSSTNIFTTTENLQTDTSSTSLNPFLQDFSIPSTLSGITKDIDQSDANVDLLSLGTDLHDTAERLSSSSTDLIDFSSSLELDLPPSQ